ncbi:hypothetical protein QTN25_002550 [Entamoeba marina]
MLKLVIIHHINYTQIQNQQDKIYFITVCLVIGPTGPDFFLECPRKLGLVLGLFCGDGTCPMKLLVLTGIEDLKFATGELERSTDEAL